MTTTTASGRFVSTVEPGRVSWPVAAARSASTLKEAVACRKQINRSLLLAPLSPIDRALWLQEACSRISERLRLQLDVRGKVPSKRSVLVSNHLSYLDPIAIARATPVAAVAKAEILGWPALGAALDDLGVIFVRRGDRFSGAVALRRMMRALDKGVSVLVFPEGTTTFGDEVLPFARGAFGVARLKGVPVVPVTLQYTRRDACWVGNAGFVPHFVSLHRNQRVIAELSFGDPIDPAVFSDPGSLAKAARRSIRELLFT